MNDYRKMVADSAASIAQLADLEPQVNQAVEMIAQCLSGDGKLLFAGNGGSAADASHLATEFVVRYKDERKPLPAIDLTASGTTLTAMVNDYPADNIFARQVEALSKSSDLLIVFSTSGKSPNILAALDKAAELNVNSIAILGRDGGPAKGKASLSIVVEQELTARIQECHQLLLHALVELAEHKLGLIS